jgi:transcriptional regulator with XRE-family HTH domain
MMLSAVAHAETVDIVGYEIIGSRLKTLLKSRELSQPDLARKSGVSVRTIQRVVNGQDIEHLSLKALADALNVPMDGIYIYKVRERRSRLT